MQDEKAEPFKGWCIIELMGHRRLAGYVREQNIAGAGFLRLDVPDVRSVDAPYETPKFTATQFYPPSSVYCLTPTTEEIARAVAARSRPEPVQRWELPAMEADRRIVDAETIDDEHDDDSPL
jgi:hypothetical protein